MKKILIILFVGLCNYSFSQNAFKTAITGNIVEPTERTIQFGDKKVEISTNGNFRLDFDIDKPAFYTLRYENEELLIYLEPDENLDISFTAKTVLSSIKFKGNLGQINNFLKNKPSIDRNVNIYLGAHYLINEWHAPESNSAARCVFVIDSLKNLYLTPLDVFRKGNKNISERFVDLYRSDINMTLNIQLLRYVDYYVFIADHNFKLVSSFPDINKYLKLTNIDNPEILGLKQYSNYCSYFLYLKGNEELQNNPSTYTSNHRWLDAMFNVVPELFKNQNVLDFWMFNQVKSYIDNDGIKDIEKNLGQFYTLCKTEKFKEDIKSYYDKEVQRQKDHLIKTYKTVNGYTLDAHIFIPKEIKKEVLLPAMVIFHGGSWYEGKPDWGFGYSDDVINICIEYRTKNRHGSTVFEEVSDAKSAIRWVRLHAKELKIDPHKIIATGSSAGAHLALCTAMADTLDEPTENNSISSKPDALLLNSAGYDATYYFTESEKKAISKISPIHLVRENLPPMLIFHGTKDTDTPYKYAENFVKKMKEKGNYVKLQPIEGSEHFIWANENYWKVYDKTKNEFFKEIGIQ